MYSRRSLLSLSIVVSVMLYGGFIGMSPRLYLNRIRPMPQHAVRPYRVHLRDEAELPPPVEPEARETGLATGPGSIEDLLKQEMDTIAPPDSLLSKTVDIPQLTDRVASDAVSREYALEPDPDSLQEVDSRIIEISREVARQDIEITRRLVRPSPERVLDENETPVLRGPSDLGGEPIVLGSLPTVSLLGGPARQGAEAGGQPGGAAPSSEEIVLPELPDAVANLPVETRVAPVVNDIRQENPYEFLDDLLDIKIDTYIPPGDKTGFFRLRVTPRKNDNMKALPKDVTFVIDASNSIVQFKLDRTARSTGEMVARLKPEDRFNIVIFRDSATSLWPDRMNASDENKRAAADFLKGLESRGQTDVYNAIRPVLQAPPREGVPGLVLLMSDGRPTTGVRDARTIINDLSARNLLGNTILAFGGGTTVNRYLLDLLAYRNKGESHVASTIESITGELPAFFSSFQAPLLVDLNANYGSIDKSQIFPREVPDFYRDRGVVVYGRFDPASDKEFFMRLTGQAEARKKEVFFKADLPKAATGDDSIARNWAFQKIYYLIGEICRVGEKPELLAELRDLSRRYNIRTSYDE